MTNEQQQVRDWMQKFGQEVPEKPTIPDLATRKLRAKLILEEALETCKALGIQVEFISSTGREIGFVPELDEIRIYDWCEPNLKEIADGCEDLKVVTEGTLVACGLVKDLPLKEEWKEEGDHYGSCLVPSYRQDLSDPLFNEVMRSNNSKLWTQEEVETQYPTVEDARQLTTSHYNTDRTKRDIVVKRLDGKVIKSPSYSPANLQPIIDEMSK